MEERLRQEILDSIAYLALQIKDDELLDKTMKLGGRIHTQRIQENIWRLFSRMGFGEKGMKYPPFVSGTEGESRRTVLRKRLGLEKDIHTNRKLKQLEGER